ncbi:MAG: 3-dehydroquinate synthase [Synergistaceae bacterium]|nr:3-dehydroquinate synthase [Synergistaceae bacterium]
MKKLSVGLAENGYDIMIGEGLLKDAGKLLRPFCPQSEPAVVVTDENAWRAWGESFASSLSDAGLAFRPVVMPAGEGNKSLKGLTDLYEALAGMKTTRNGLVVALGGGVVGDLGGFAAATWMRGVRLVQIPTTLLAQVDSSVGGKTAVNLPQGKNLVGVFYQPKLVLIDPLTLRTLPERETRSGMAEVIKYGAIRSASLFQALADPHFDLSDVIYECCRIKSEIVARDERDFGERMLLNFGHTLGHAIEKQSGFERYRHGEAVAFGMVLAASLGEEMRFTEPGVADALRRLMARHGIETEYPESVAELTPTLSMDKKSLGDGVQLILLRRVGEATARRSSLSEIGAALESMQKRREGHADERASVQTSQIFQTSQAFQVFPTSPDPRAQSKLERLHDDVKTIGRFPRGLVVPPPSKSLCHRAAICAALAGESVVENFGRSEDVDATLAGVGALGLAETHTEGDVLIAKRRGGLRGSATASRETRIVDCNESGSTLRFLLPLAALDGRSTVFTGRGRLLDRPLEVYAKVFADAGAFFAREPGRALVRGPLRSGSYALPGDVSSQFVSGLLLALPLLEGNSEIRLSTRLQSRSYVDLTLDVMRRFGVEVEAGDSLFRVRGGQRYLPARYRVEADYSQAAFFLASSALGRDVEVAGLDPASLQGDRAILRVLREMGAETTWRETGVRGKVVSVRAAGLSAVTVDASEIPDLVPPIAALCCFCEGTSRIVNAARLKLKESDRLRALATELRKLGAQVEEAEDSLSVTGAPRLRGGRVDAWNDHRVAMSLATAAIRCDAPVSLTGWRSVNKSYPEFWNHFEGQGHGVWNNIWKEGGA